jgi:tRNA (guanine-N7-)-methyltransferase
MGKNKLAKFEDIAGYPHVFQYSYNELKATVFALKGHWQEGFFKNTNPVVLELGCGKGEYTVGMARRFPCANFIGVDIKGARMWSGAKASLEAGMTNVAFLRTHIEELDAFFAPGEVAELWLTFPDPQMKKINKRLTSVRFMQSYSRILADKGIIHLKTDSLFLHTYTEAMTQANGLTILCNMKDLYASPIADEILSIRTFYEQQWIERGITIKYLRFLCEPRNTWIEPDIAIERDTYRSFNRGKGQVL